MKDEDREIYLRVKGKVGAWRLLTFAKNFGIEVVEIQDASTKEAVTREKVANPKPLGGGSLERVIKLADAKTAEGINESPIRK